MGGYSWCVDFVSYSVARFGREGSSLMSFVFVRLLDKPLVQFVSASPGRAHVPRGNMLVVGEFLQ